VFARDRIEYAFLRRQLTGEDIEDSSETHLDNTLARVEELEDAVTVPDDDATSDFLPSDDASSGGEQPETSSDNHRPKRHTKISNWWAARVESMTRRLNGTNTTNEERAGHETIAKRQVKLEARLPVLDVDFRIARPIFKNTTSKAWHSILVGDQTSFEDATQRTDWPQWLDQG
jgi:hypothetical protein